jgi:uncharacterized membrane protein
VLALLGMWRLGRRLVPETGRGSGAALLLAVSPWFVGYSNLARPYALALALSIGASVAALALCEAAPRKRWRVAFVGFSLAGLYTVYHYAFVLVWHAGLLLGVAARLEPVLRRRELTALAVSLAAIGAGFAPWLPALLGHLQATGGGVHYFSGFPELAAWPGGLGRLLTLFFLGEAHASAGAIILGVGFLLLSGCTFPLAVAAFRKSALARLDPAARAFWASCLLYPLALVAADAWADTHTFFISKTSFALLPILLLLVLRAWRSAPSARVAWVGGLAWTLLLAAATLANITTRAATRLPYEVAAAHLQRSDAPTHRVMASSTLRGYAIPLLLTLRDADVTQVRISAPPPEEVVGAVRAAVADPAVDQVSLLDLAADYRPGQRYSKEILDRAAAVARAAGWRVRWLPLDADPQGGPPPGRTLWILSPLPVKFFAM